MKTQEQKFEELNSAGKVKKAEVLEQCPNCGHESHIFSHGGARQEADRLGVEFLGEIPLDIDIRTTSDGGQPIVVSQPESEHGKTFRLIAGRLWDKLSAAGRAMPEIIVE